MGVSSMVRPFLLVDKRVNMKSVERFWLIWYGGCVDDKKKGTDSPSTNSGASPGPVVNQLDDSTRDTFATGRPLEDSPETSLCKHCKKSVLKSARKAHIEKCLSDKKEAARKRKEAKERAARRKEEEGAAAEEGGEKLEKKKGKEKKEKKEKEKEKKVDAEGDTAMGGNNAEGEEDDDDPEPSASPEVVKKTPAGLKSAKKTAGKKSEEGGEKKQGKKRKAEGDAEKMPKQKKKKDEPKAKIVKAKGMFSPPGRWIAWRDERLIINSSGGCGEAVWCHHT
jgi:SAGA-associated factor 73